VISALPSNSKALSNDALFIVADVTTNVDSFQDSLDQDRYFSALHEQTEKDACAIVRE
jgi:hypothetical protein